MTAALVLAKAPVAGRVKTRLAASVGDRVAADLAAAALLDTLDVVARAFPDRPRVLALAGDLEDTAARVELVAAVDSWIVVAQRGDSFAERIANAHRDTLDATGCATLQIGMDTPHVTSSHLIDAAAALDERDGVLGPAEDGGWWLLGLRDPLQAALLLDVPMSTAETGALTMRALAGSVRMTTTATTYDIDTAADAARSAADAPETRFARSWNAIGRVLR